MIDELFPFEARASCFNYLKEWCGYGQYANICKERYSNMVKAVNKGHHLTTLTAAIEFQRSKLELVAMEAMITLCSDPISKTIKGSPDISVLVSFDISGLLCWIDALFNSSNKSIRS